MQLYRTTRGQIVEINGQAFHLGATDWNTLFNSENLAQKLQNLIEDRAATSIVLEDVQLLPPIEGQEVWAAGVTYYRSRDARMEESKASGGDDFYARVYEADRPELFMKATAHRVVGTGQSVRIRQDSHWNVPEPELALVINVRGELIGYTVGNDMSSRDIEGENPLYLPQAKVYDRCCGLGPGILVTQDALPPTTPIRLKITRGRETVFEGETSLAQLKRHPQELIDYLYRDNSFPQGCFLLTGTGIVPGGDFTLQHGDTIAITIDPIGTLTNTVE